MKFYFFALTLLLATGCPDRRQPASPNRPEIPKPAPGHPEPAKSPPFMKNTK